MLPWSLWSFVTRRPPCSHLIAGRSFAMFHPMRHMLFRPLEIDGAIHLYGLTVWDVQETFQERYILLNSQTFSSVSHTYLQCGSVVSIPWVIRYLEHAPDYRAAFPPGCDIREVSNGMHTLRVLLVVLVCIWFFLEFHPSFFTVIHPSGLNKFKWNTGIIVGQPCLCHSNTCVQWEKCHQEFNSL